MERLRPNVLILRMLGFLRPVWRTALLAGLVIAARVGLEVAGVSFLRPAITQLAELPRIRPDVGIVPWIMGTDASAQKLRAALVLMTLSQAGLALLVYLRPVWESKLSMRAVFHMRQQVFDRLQTVGFKLHDRMSSGKLINRSLSDLQTVRSFVNMSLLSSLDIALSVAAYVGLLFVCSPLLGTMLLVLVPAWWLVIRRLSRRMQPLYRAQQEATDRLVSAITENVGGVHVVRAFGTEATEIRRFRTLTEAVLARVFSVVGLQARLTPTMRAMASCAHVAMFVLACRLIGVGRMQVGDLMVLGVAMGTILMKLTQVNAMAEAYQKAMVSAQRLFEILDTPPDVAAPPEAPPLTVTRGQIALERVTFGYEPGRPVLQDIEAVIPGGRMTAVVGPTGSGKSTLANLLGRFYDPWSGRILIDGQDLRAVEVATLRRLVGFVFQETFLFSDTVRANLLYGRRDVSEEMLRAAARAAQADAFIESLPNGYDTILGEKGVLLSGGQRQRLALARALVYDPEILVLDDATAALDTKTERALHAVMGPLFEGRTVVVIAHRLATVRRADHVLVMEGGRILDGGTHEDLMRRDGHYRELVRLQLQEPAPVAEPPDGTGARAPRRPPEVAAQ